MKKVIFFENYDGRLHRCIFAGLDNNNRPQWVKVDQGEESRFRITWRRTV